MLNFTHLTFTINNKKNKTLVKALENLSKLNYLFAAVFLLRKIRLFYCNTTTKCWKWLSLLENKLLIRKASSVVILFSNNSIIADSLYKLKLKIIFWHKLVWNHFLKFSFIALIQLKYYKKLLLASFGLQCFIFLKKCFLSVFKLILFCFNLLLI